MTGIEIVAHSGARVINTSACSCLTSITEQNLRAQISAMFAAAFQSNDIKSIDVSKLTDKDYHEHLNTFEHAIGAKRGNLEAALRNMELAASVVVPPYVNQPDPSFDVEAIMADARYQEIVSLTARLDEIKQQRLATLSH